MGILHLRGRCRIGKLRYSLPLLLCLVSAGSQTSAVQVISISPTCGAEGTKVEIRGSGFASANRVSFGKIAATFRIASGDKIVALVPRWAVSAKIRVMALGGQATSPSEFVVQNDPRIPEDVGWKSGYVHPVRAPKDFKSALLWGIAIADSRGGNAGAARVEIASAKLSCRVDGKDFVLNDDAGKIRGGLYARKPWFGNDDAHDPMPMSSSDDVVVLPIGQHPDRIWHFWSASPRAALPAGRLDGCTVKVRVRIFPGALVQIGMDYWRSTTALWAGSDVNNHEAGASNWYFPSEEWQELVFTDVGGVEF